MNKAKGMLHQSEALMKHLQTYKFFSENPEITAIVSKIQQTSVNFSISHLFQQNQTLSNLSVRWHGF